MTKLRLLLAALFIATTPLLITACEQEGPAEESLEEVGDEIDDATGN